MSALIPYLMSVCALGLLSLFWWRRRQRMLALARQDLGATVASCRQLVRLIGHLQQHRGMSSAWLSGDAAFLPRLKRKQAEIAELVPALTELVRREARQACPCLTANELSLFSFRWTSMLEALQGMTPEQSITRHSQQIACVLDWLATLGETRIESLTADGAAIGVIRNFASRLPQLTECLGQARAIGSSVAARRACAPVARVRLMFLVSRAETLLEQAAVAWDSGRTTRDTRLALEEMALTVRTKMLLSTGVVVGPDEYFALATRAIDSVFAWIDAWAERAARLDGEAPAAAWTVPAAQ